MPELPEVETVRRGLAAALEGRRIENVEVRRRDLRIPIPEDFAKRLRGRTLTGLGRRAKYLVARFDDDTVLLAHLGMTGRILVDRPGGAAQGGHAAHVHVVLEAGNGTTVRFSDPRRFGLMTLTDRSGLSDHPLLRGLGPEPLSDGFTGPALADRLAGRRISVKAALLDQKVVAGVGNIYACEALHAAGLSPRRGAESVRGRRADRLAAAVRSVLEDAIAAGGSSLRDHVAPDGELGYFQHSFKVYGRDGQPCPGCGAGIRRITQTGRSTYHCAVCQR